jgi:hypothetical protein
LKQKFKNREQIKREIKKDVILYAQSKWPITFSRVFDIQMLSGPLIDEVPYASIAIGRDQIRYYADDTGIVLNELNYSEITDIICDQLVSPSKEIRSIESFFSDPVVNYYHYTLQSVIGDYTFSLPSKEIFHR